MTPYPMVDDENDVGIDGAGAMADLILGTTGILLVVLAALGPVVLSQPAGVSHEPLAMPAFDALAGYPGRVLFASAAGLVIAPDAPPIPISDIASSPDLAAIGTARPLLIIDPAGVEAAFHASARLAALGVVDIDRVRIDKTCGDIRGLERRGPAWVLVCRGA